MSEETHWDVLPILLHDVVQSAPAAVIAIDLEGRVRLWNPSAEKVFGWSREEVLGEPLPTIPESERQTFRQIFKNQIEGRAYLQKPCRRQRKDGTVLDVTLSTAPLRKPDGTIYGTIGFLVDVTEQRQTEKQLKRTHDLLETIFASMDEAVFVVDPEDRTIVSANPAVERIFGYSVEEVIGRNTAFLHKDRESYNEWHRLGLTSLEQQETFRKEWLMRCKSGDLFWAEISVTSIQKEKGWRQGVVSVVRNISERITAERQNRLLSDIIEAAPDFVGTADAEGHTWFINPAGRRMTGLEADESLSNHEIKDLHPAWANEILFREGIPQAVQTGTWQGETAVLGPEKEEIPISQVIIAHRRDNGEISHLSTIARDIRDWKELEDQLRHQAEQLEESERFFRAVFEQAGVGVAVADSRTGHFLKVNEHCSHLWGYSREELESMTFQEISDAEDLEEDLEKMHRLRRNEIREFSMDKRYLHKDGHVVWARLTVSPFWEAGEKPDRHIGVFQDITERKRAENDLKRLNQTLRIVSQCNESLIRADTEEGLLEGILSNLVDFGNYVMALVWTLDADKDTFTPKVYPPQGEEVLRGNTSEGCALMEHISRICRQSFSREILLSEEMFADRECPECRRLIEAFDVRAAFSLALNVKNDHLGCLVLFSAEEGFYTEEINLLKELADDLAYGLRSLRTEAAHRLAQKDLRLRNRAMEASSNGIMISEAKIPEMPVIYVNPAFERITGFSKEEILGESPRFLDDDDRKQKELVDIWAAIRNNRSANALVRNHRKDGSLFWNEFSVAPVPDAEGNTTHFVSILNDVTERKRYEEELERKTNYDDLTGLPNRNLLGDRIQQAIGYAQRSGKYLALFLLDLDRFQIINDSLGHNLGNELLKLVAERLRTCLRSEDTLCRLGGDEFVCLFTDIKTRDTLLTLVEKVQKVLSPPFRIGGRSLSVSASIGISIYPDDAKDEEGLIRSADIAMYQAKEKGRDTFQTFAPEMDVRIVEEMDLEADLRRALEQNEFLLQFQPKVDVGSGRIIGSEALVRWEHPERGRMSPGAFIPLAEQTGLIEPLGEWVLREACNCNKMLQEKGLASIPVAANVSARQFRSENFVATVGRILAESGLEPQWLDIELTESMLMGNPESAAKTMHRIKRMGPTLSLDDFGTGYSSLSYLRRFPVDYLKIDRSFIADVTTDEESAAVVCSIIAVAHNLKLKAVAEGVETEDQLEFLRECDCDIYQGFFFAKPLHFKDFAALLGD